MIIICENQAEVDAAETMVNDLFTSVCACHGCLTNTVGKKMNRRVEYFREHGITIRVVDPEQGITTGEKIFKPEPVEDAEEW